MILYATVVGNQSDTYLDGLGFVRIWDLSNKGSCWARSVRSNSLQSVHFDVHSRTHHVMYSCVYSCVRSCMHCRFTRGSQALERREFATSSPWLMLRIWWKSLDIREEGGCCIITPSRPAILSFPDSVHWLLLHCSTSSFRDVIHVMPLFYFLFCRS